MDSSFTLTLNGSTLTWKFSFADPDPHDFSQAIDNTVDHYVLWYTTDNTNYYIMDNIGPSEAGCDTGSDNVNCSTGVNLKNYTWGVGPQTLYIQATGKPVITNHMSDSVIYHP